MACGYWDYSDTGTTTGEMEDWNDYNSPSTNSGIITWDSSSTIRVVRRIIVKIPKNWNKSKIAAYIKLLNLDTNTRWKIEMVFVGDLAIVDPDIEIREMDEFVILLKHRASREDSQKINDFFKEE